MTRSCLNNPYFRFLDLYGEDMAAFKRHVKKYKVKGLQIDYKEW
jgi:hypothetical protein